MRWFIAGSCDNVLVEPRTSQGTLNCQWDANPWFLTALGAEFSLHRSFRARRILQMGGDENKDDKVSKRTLNTSPQAEWTFKGAGPWGSFTLGWHVTAYVLKGQRYPAGSLGVEM